MKPRGIRGLLLSGLLVAALGAPAAAQSGLAENPTLVTGIVTGRFQDEVRSLPFAMVEVLSGTARQRAITDADGRYVVHGLQPGEVTLSVRHAAYEPISMLVVVPEHETVSVDIELLAAPVALTPLDVRASARTRVRGISGVDDEDTDPELEMQALEVGPGLGEPGMADVIGALPGNDPGNPTDVLFMRGSTTDLKLVLLDGVPVYTPFHVAGLMRSFEPAVIGAAELHVGGAPARFDGGLSQILELTTRTARRDGIHMSSSVDLMSASGALEMPMGRKAGLVASARGLHGLGSRPFGSDRPYGYHDALLSTDFEPAAGHEIHLTGFLNDESVKLDLSPSDADARWANRAGSASYHGDLGAATVGLTAGMSGYRATLPLQPHSSSLEPLPPAVLASGSTDRSRIVGEVAFGGAATTVRTGASYEHIDVSFSARELDGPNGAYSHGSTDALGAFLDASQSLGSNVSLRVGLRADHFGGESTRLAPRAAITWMVAPGAMISIAAGRYHQPTRTPDVDVEQTLVEVAESGVPPVDLLPIATADHVVFSLDHRLSEYVRIGLQGFWKSYEGLPSAEGAIVRNSGLDIRILRGSERAAAWLGYGLSWYWSAVDLSGRHSGFTGRHLLSAGVSGHLAGPFRGEARVAFGAGLPYTSIPLSGSTDPMAGVSDPSGQDVVTNPFDSGLEDSFLRLDAEIYAILRPDWGSNGWTVRPYVRLLNALDRRDSLFYAFESWRSESVRPLAEMPVLPLVGVAVSF
jgi:hypothetical protein